MHVNWFKDPDNVVYCKEEEVLPRLSKELGIGDLAERVGITPANLSILKNNKAKAIRFSTLEAICRELSCQPGDILEFEEEQL